MVARDASRRFSTSILVANRPADSVQSVAGLMIGAVLVVMTNRGDASHARITLRPLRANALGSMGHCRALRTTTAHDVTDEAGGNAVVISASLVVRAVVVRLTFRCEKKPNYVMMMMSICVIKRNSELTKHYRPISSKILKIEDNEEKEEKKRDLNKNWQKQKYTYVGNIESEDRRLNRLGSGKRDDD